MIENSKLHLRRQDKNDFLRLEEKEFEKELDKNILEEIDGTYFINSEENAVQKSLMGLDSQGIVWNRINFSRKQSRQRRCSGYRSYRCIDNIGGKELERNN